MNATPPDDTPDIPETDPPAARPEEPAAWAPATDAGVPGPDSEAPRPRRKEKAAKPLAVRRSEPRAKAQAREAQGSETEGGEAPASPDQGTPEGERIAKAIARAGVASRRDAEAMIAEGRVLLNGEVLASPAINVTEADRIVVDGEPLPARERTRLWLFHKPRGLVTTARDPEGRQTVFETLPEDLPRVVAVGRLDINTEGLLLLTNDGGLAKVIAHPDTGWLRRYRVRAHGETTQAELDRLRKGVTIDGMEYGPIEASLDRMQGDNLWLTLGLREGKNREVKRILEHLGLAVNRLIRLSFGPFQLGDLEAGLVEEVRTKVLKEQLGPGLSAQAEVDFESPVREPVTPFGSPKGAAREAAAAARGAARTDSRREAPGRRGAEAPRTGRGGPAASPVRPPARVPTGGMGPGPRRSVWRADETDGPAPLRAAKVPRRGADPKAERAAAAERGRERVGSIRTGERRVVVERLQASPPEPAPEPHRRTRFATIDPATGTRKFRRADGTEGGSREGASRERPSREGVSDRAPPERRGPSGEARLTRSGPRAERPDRERSDRERPAREHSARERPARERSDRERPSQDRPFRERPPRGEASRGQSSRGESSRGGPRAETGARWRQEGGEGEARRSSGPRSGPRGEGKPGGFGAKPGGFGAKPGGFGGKPGGRFGDKPGGGFRGKAEGRSDAASGGPRSGARSGARGEGKPGGFGAKPGGGSGPRAGGKPGGGKPGGFGGKPGGFGGKPGGRPGGKPRGGR